MGALIGDMNAIMEHGVLSYSLETTSDCSLFEISAEDLRAFLRKNPGVALSMFNHTYIE